MIYYVEFYVAPHTVAQEKVRAACARSAVIKGARQSIFGKDCTKVRISERGANYSSFAYRSGPTGKWRFEAARLMGTENAPASLM